MSTLDPVAAQVEDRELAACSAKKDGRQVVSLSAFERGSQFLAVCDVYPVTGLSVDPLRPAPYRFATEAEARLFVSEAAQALTYLGCDVL